MSELPYNAHDVRLTAQFGFKVYKLPLHLADTCPNFERGGCTFCGGAGAGFGFHTDKSITEQLSKGVPQTLDSRNAGGIIAYFQDYTNTYVPFERFRAALTEAADYPGVVGISVATRPDALPRRYAEFMSSLACEKKLYMVLELGLQSANVNTLRRINRGHGVAAFVAACRLADNCGLPVCAHMLLGLPGDTAEDDIEGAEMLSALGVHSVKLHQLYLPEGTVLRRSWEAGEFVLPDMWEYAERAGTFLAHLAPNILVERVAARTAGSPCFAQWNGTQADIENAVAAWMREHGMVQGCLYHYE